MPLGSLTPGLGGSGLKLIKDLNCGAVSGSRSDLRDEGLASLNLVMPELKGYCVETGTGLGGSMAAGDEYFSLSLSSGVLSKPAGYEGTFWEDSNTYFSTYSKSSNWSSSCFSAETSFFQTSTFSLIYLASFSLSYGSC